MAVEYPLIEFASAAEWEAWLEANHASADGVEVRFAKKASGITTVSFGEALDLALCFGWIDGRRKGIDATCYQQRFTPRRARSLWSQVNREKVAKLIAEGRMRPSGLAEIERAKADGRWDAAYAPPSRAETPAELERALDATPGARAAFDGLDSRNRYALLHRIITAKKPETRARRAQQFAEMLARGEKPYP